MPKRNARFLPSNDDIISEATGDNPSDFLNPHHHYDKIEEVRVYGKDGKLKEKVSPKKQLDDKWERMRLDPLAESAMPSGDGLAKRRRGQQKNRNMLSINIKKAEKKTYGSSRCRFCGKEFTKLREAHYYCLPEEGKRSCRLLHHDKLRKVKPVIKKCPKCGKTFQQKRKDWKYCLNPCRSRPIYKPKDWGKERLEK